MSETQNFRGWRAAILHRNDATSERLTRQLTLLGFRSAIQCRVLEASDLPDMVLVDADEGWSGQLPWEGGNAPCPVVALLGSEAPGRVAWAIGHGAGAIIAKPLAASAVYPALVMAHAIFAERSVVSDRLAHLEERVKMRPLVHAAVERIIAARQVEEDQAYRSLRNRAMEKRLAIEQLAASILCGTEPLPEAV